MPSAKSISGNYEKQKVFGIESFRKEIIRCLEANRDNKDLKVSSIYDLLEELYVDSGCYMAFRLWPKAPWGFFYSSFYRFGAKKKPFSLCPATGSSFYRRGISSCYLYFLVRIVGRFKMRVIDKDRCLVYEHKYGEITPLSCPYNINSVDKLGYITYLSNKYSVPKILRNTKLRTKVWSREKAEHLWPVS